MLEIYSWKGGRFDSLAAVADPFDGWQQAVARKSSIVIVGNIRRGTVTNAPIATVVATMPQSCK